MVMIDFRSNHRILADIEDQIDKLAVAYSEAPGLILTEDDLKCLLHSKLSGLSPFRGAFVTQDPGVLATTVHSEVSWFDSKNKLTIKPDLTILDPQRLKILSGNARRASLPSKGYGFDGKAIILELKFIRQKSGITDSLYNREILRDWQKIERLRKKLEDQGSTDAIFCYFVIFNKGAAACRNFGRFLSENRNGVNHKILYKPGGVF